MESKDIFVDTGGHCFLCYKQVSSSETLKMCLRDICRFLEIFPGAMTTKYLEINQETDNTLPRTFSGKSKSEFSVGLCVQCFAVTEKLSTFIQELELTKMLLHDQLKTFYQILKHSTDVNIYQNNIGNNLLSNLKCTVMEKSCQQLKLIVQNFPKVVLSRVDEKEKLCQSTSTPNLQHIKQEIEEEPSSENVTGEFIPFKRWKCAVDGCKRTLYLPKSIQLHKRICVRKDKDRMDNQKFNSVSDKRTTDQLNNDATNTPVVKNTPVLAIDSENDKNLHSKFVEKTKHFIVSDWKQIGERFQCPFCEARCSSIKDKRVHILCHHIDTLFLQQKFPTIPGTLFQGICSDVLKCTICQSRELIRNGEAQSVHKRFLKVAVKKASIKCKYCCKWFSKTANLKYHLVMQHYEKLICKVLKLQRNVENTMDLIRIIDSRFSVYKPWGCKKEDCVSKFRSLKELIKHLTTCSKTPETTKITQQQIEENSFVNLKSNSNLSSKAAQHKEVTTNVVNRENNPNNCNKPINIPPTTQTHEMSNKSTSQNVCETVKQPPVFNSVSNFLTENPTLLQYQVDKSMSNYSWNPETNKWEINGLSEQAQHFPYHESNRTFQERASSNHAKFTCCGMIFGTAELDVHKMTSHLDFLFLEYKASNITIMQHKRNCEYILRIEKVSCQRISMNEGGIGMRCKYCDTIFESDLFLQVHLCLVHNAIIGKKIQLLYQNSSNAHSEPTMFWGCNGVSQQAGYQAAPKGPYNYDSFRKYGYPQGNGTLEYQQSFYNDLLQYRSGNGYNTTNQNYYYYN